MSLDFDFGDMIKRLGKEEYNRITDHPTEKGRWHPVSDALVWICLIIKMSGITEKNADEFYDRLVALQAVAGGEILTSEGKVFITKEDVQNHIGLRTNVQNKSMASFKSDLYHRAIQEGNRLCNSQGMSAYQKLKHLADQLKEKSS